MATTQFYAKIEERKPKYLICDKIIFQSSAKSSSTQMFAVSCIWDCGENYIEHICLTLRMVYWSLKLII